MQMKKLALPSSPIPRVRPPPRPASKSLSPGQGHSWVPSFPEEALVVVAGGRGAVKFFHLFEKGHDGQKFVGWPLRLII